MKISKQQLRQIILESIEEVVRLDPREGDYGVDPTGELGKEVRDAEELQNAPAASKSQLKISTLDAMQLANFLKRENLDRPEKLKELAGLMRQSFVDTYGTTPEQYKVK